MASPKPLKRPYSEVDLDDDRQAPQGSPSPARGDPKQLLLPPNIHSGDCSLLSSTPDRSRAISPAANTPGSTAGDRPSTLQSGPVSFTHSAPKKQKLTFAEKESRRLEKEAKDRLKAEEKTRKEAEKQEKEAERRKREEEIKEQKRRKEEEKDEKRRAKEAEKQLKEEEKKQKDAEKKAKEVEKHKKDKSQLRLNAFFAKTPLPVSGTAGSDIRGDSPCSRRSSITSIEGKEAFIRSRSNSVSGQKTLQSDYERAFPPFFLQSHTGLAPYSRFLRDKEALELVRSRIDGSLKSSEERQRSLQRPPSFDAAALLHLPVHKGTRRNHNRTTVREIIARIHGTVDHPIDLTDLRSETLARKPTHWLKAISTKYLKFAEDVRPPYVGTYSKLPARCTVSKLCRNPFTRALPQANYDYDSEAEWEEPGEGEDLDSEGEEELGEDEDGDEMDGFLDDEDAGDGIGVAGNRRRLVIGDLEPVSTGLRWDDGQERLGGPKPGDGQSTLDLHPFRLEVMLDTIQTPIDPFSTTYWPSPTRPSTTTSNAPPTSMHPPRLPLHTIHPSNTVAAPSAPAASKPHPLSASSTPAKAPKPLKTVAPQLMAEFKKAVQGSDLTKAGLIEILKKQFPKTSKDVIKDTLGLVAERVGSREADKRWVVRD
ncbi:MAG: hypothetical protein FRX48_02953 [Lasallia pustulata]|uniref:Chromatin assembly factor 1 subunit A n=1 Tax=Lasallia pustulata TaxID=136370 RepID=A0A5M8PVY1_9LECA|nr:MAG: hypothetical protein FRX48_02953 [Lasallia pustulata]